MEDPIEIHKNIISNMSEMFIVPPKLFKESLINIIQKNRHKMDSASKNKNKRTKNQKNEDIADENDENI